MRYAMRALRPGLYVKRPDLHLQQLDSIAEVRLQPLPHRLAVGRDVHPRQRRIARGRP
jgi:hypothetical protein